jgi:hypothetical protein
MARSPGRALIAACTSLAAPSILRSRSNWMVIAVRAKRAYRGHLRDPRPCLRCQPVVAHSSSRMRPFSDRLAEHPQWVCRSTRRCVTVREMKEGPFIVATPQLCTILVHEGSISASRLTPSSLRSCDTVACHVTVVAPRGFCRRLPTLPRKRGGLEGIRQRGTGGRATPTMQAARCVVPWHHSIGGRLRIHTIRALRSASVMVL